jgi:hypothetical protein
MEREEALARLRARAAEWTTANCELVICTCEFGDMLRDLLAVLEGADGAGHQA